MSEHGTPDKGEWGDWAVAAADLAEPTFQGLVGEIDADQEAWAGESRPRTFAPLTPSLRMGADTDLRKPAVSSPSA